MDLLINIFLENPLAQVIGILAAIIMTWSGIIKDDKIMNYVYTLSFIFWAYHFYLLDLYTASIAYIFMIFRNIFLYKFNKSKIIYIIFASIPVFLLYFTYQNFNDILITLAPILYIFGLYFFTKEKLRYILLLISALWLYISIISGSIGGVITEITYSIGVIIGIYKIIKEKKQHNYQKPIIHS